MGGQRFEGKNLEEALESAATALGVERFLVSYHVVLEKRGFLGGTRRVVIEAEVADAPTLDAAPERGPAGDSRSDHDRQRRGERGSGRSPRGRRDGRNSGEPRFRSASLQPAGNQTFGPAPDQEFESPGALRAHEWIQRVIELSGLDLEVRTSEDDSTVRVNFYGPSSADLIARDGELLDSLQVLTNKALVGRSTEKPVEFDCAGFKQQRVDQIGQRAQELAERVRSGGGEQLLPAMSPIERRIVHLALEGDDDVTTESRGEGFYKRVAIILRKAQTSE